MDGGTACIAGGDCRSSVAALLLFVNEEYIYIAFIVASLLDGLEHGVGSVGLSGMRELPSDARKLLKDYLCVSLHFLINIHNIISNSAASSIGASLCSGWGINNK